MYILRKRGGHCWKSAHLWEIHQNFSHLIASLTTTDVDNDITVGELGHRLTDDSLSTAESTRNTDSTALNTGEKSIENTLTNDEWRVGGKFIIDWSGHTDGPLVHHTMLRLLAVEFNFQ